MAVSKQFGIELPNELKASGFSVLDSSPADVVLRINLVQQKVAIDESSVRYKIRVAARNGTILSRDNGNGVLFAKMAGAAPAACPDRFTDLEWLYSNDPLFSAARKITTNLWQ